MKSSFTRHGKMSLAGAFSDFTKSATRLYINNFEDKGRQNTIDMLLVGGKNNKVRHMLTASGPAHGTSTRGFV